MRERQVHYADENDKIMDTSPEQPAYKSVSLDDKALFEKFFHDHPASTSELTFTNFFIWRDCDRSKAAVINGNICVYAEPENEPPYFFEPLGSSKMEETIDACAKKIPRFSRVSEGFAKKYFADAKRFRIELDRNNADYVYNTSDLINLKGKKYDGKRNKIRKFLKNNIPIYQPLTEELVPDCLILLDKWAQERKGGICFDAPIKEALKNLKVLGLTAAAVRINGRIGAFTVGERLNQDTAIIYIEVADPEIDGLSQYINQQFCRNEWADTLFINREADLGDAGLRRAKLSYHPAQMANKYTVTLID